MMKNLIAAGFLLSVSASGAATIAKSVIRQNWPYDPTVTIDYELEGELGERVDIDVKLEDGAGIISVSANSFSGDLSNVAPGVHRIVWDPVKAGYVNVSATSLKVALTARPAASEYLVIGGLGTENVTVETLSEAPDAGFNADQYKKDKIVLKRIRAGRFRMGSPDTEGGRNQNETLHDVILTNDYWIGVFPVTRQQWMHIRKDVTPGDHYYLTGPAISVSWNDICGENGGRAGTTAVDEGSFLGLLGAKVNQLLPQGYVVALPTEAQWEYPAEPVPIRHGITGPAITSMTKRRVPAVMLEMSTRSMTISICLPVTSGQRELSPIRTTPRKSAAFNRTPGGFTTVTETVSNWCSIQSMSTAEVRGRAAFRWSSV
ncbi:MAG: SUMF1/EgtB/PvdO family nonheme iron enzyme [Kiritimatiellae bacterium]|nr:SUMF1/EgtB/PvdO family nonheme iron enzyme [Kiritimatiellia bacterium]